MEMWNLPDEERIAAAQARLLVERCQHLHRTTPIVVPPELLARLTDPGSWQSAA